MHLSGSTTVKFTRRSVTSLCKLLYMFSDKMSTAGRRTGVAKDQRSRGSSNHRQFSFFKKNSKNSVTGNWNTFSSLESGRSSVLIKWPDRRRSSVRCLGRNPGVEKCRPNILANVSDWYESWLVRFYLTSTFELWCSSDHLSREFCKGFDNFLSRAGSCWVLIIFVSRIFLEWSSSASLSALKVEKVLYEESLRKFYGLLFNWLSIVPFWNRSFDFSSIRRDEQN